VTDGIIPVLYEIGFAGWSSPRVPTKYSLGRINLISKRLSGLDF